MLCQKLFIPSVKVLIITAFLAIQCCLQAAPPVGKDINNAATFWRKIPAGSEIEELTWIAEHYSLVSLKPQYVNLIKKLNPNVKTLCYATYSTVQKSHEDGFAMYTHFRNYIDDKYAEGSDAMFTHARADVFYSSATSSLYKYAFIFDKYWKYNGTSYVELTWQVKTVLIPTPNDIMYLGYSEGRFREVNFNLYAYGSGLKIVWEYWNGSSWKELQFTDATDNLSKAGKISFFPPRDWARRKISTDMWSSYYLRFYTKVAGTSPWIGAKGGTIRNEIQQENWCPYDGVNKRYTFPGWDPSNDANGDGFVDDTEFANLVNPRASARFAYQGRHAPLLYQPTRFYGRNWFLNLKESAVKSWAAKWVQDFTAAVPLMDGVWLDGATDTLPASLEYGSRSDWYAANKATLADIKAANPTKIISINVAEYYNREVIGQPDVYDRDTYAEAADIFHCETQIIAGNSWEDFNRHLQEHLKRAKTGIPPAMKRIPTVLEGRKFNGLETMITEERNQIYCLAGYYLMQYKAPFGETYFIYGGRNWRHSNHHENNWFNAITYGIGESVGDYYEWASGDDPESKRHYVIYARKYTNALVLLKPRSYGKDSNGNWGTGNVTAATATTHPLPGSYRPLNADGTCGPVIAKITLRNAEGAILIETTHILQED